jgi:hypothetical protein
VTLLDKVDGVNLQPYTAGGSDPMDEFEKARGQASGPVLGAAGPAPAWIQSDETPDCGCGQPMRFVLQLEDAGGGGINFGDAGVGYVFLCGRCPDPARFLWQCC